MWTCYAKENTLVIAKHPFPTIQEMTLHMDFTGWSILKSDWLYSFQPKMEKLYTVSKNKKSGDTWNNKQIWPLSTEWSRAKANRVLLRECTGHSKYSLPKIQERTLPMDITRWSIPKSDWLYSFQSIIEKLYTVSKNKTGSGLRLRSWTLYCKIQTEIEESRENH